MSDHGRPWLTGDVDASPRTYDESYKLSGKIMLSAIVILFFVVVFMVCLHVYARWYLIRARRRRTRRSRRGSLVFHVDGASAATSGLDAAVLHALPVFVVGKDSAGEESGECAVCLSEFATGEAGRRLPKCGHSFHTECIDMWFHSHATCPLCRSPVEAGSGQEVQTDVAESDPNGLCSECEGSSSATMTIEVPRRNFESVVMGSPASQTTPFRSPMSRMLSFTRILSRDRRNGGVSPSGNNGNGNGSASGSAVNELDVERGKVGTQTQ